MKKSRNAAVSAATGNSSHALPYLTVAPSTGVNSRAPRQQEPSSQTPAQPAHWHNENSVSYSRKAPKFHFNAASSVSQGGGQDASVSFHVPPHAQRAHQMRVDPTLQDTETVTSPAAVSPASSSSSSSMPVQLQWPTHAHPLIYGAAAPAHQPESTTHLNAPAIATCTCKNCGNVSYASAVYSCSQRAQNAACATWHVCLSCAIDHVRSQHQEHAPRGIQRDEDEDTHHLPLTKENVAMNAFKAQQQWVAPGQLTVNLGLVAPLSYDKGKLAREPWHVRGWVQNVQRDAAVLALRVALPCSLHPQHPLLFYPISPTPSHGAPLNSPLFCTALLSEFCVSHEFEKTPRACYACRECNFRLCMPCFRSFLSDIEYQATLNMSHQQAKDTSKELARCQHRSRIIDDQRLAHQQTVESSMRSLPWQEQQMNVFLVAAALYSLALINAMISQTLGSGFSAALLNSVIISIVSFLPAVLARFLYSFTLSNVQQLQEHALAIESLYLDPELHYNGLIDTVEPQTIAVSRLSAVAKELLQSLFSHHASYVTKQRFTMWAAVTAYVLDLLSVCLFISSVVLLFVTAICSLPTYALEVDQCELKAAAPIGVVLFLTFCYPRILVLIPLPMKASIRMLDSLMTKNIEQRRTKKRTLMADYAVE